jgi:uncharacterized protein YjcR
MPKPRDPRRDEAKKLFLKKKGKITPKEIAKKLGVEPKVVRGWKCKDKWESQLPKRGAPKGNKNAAGNKGGAAPKGNTNAETHGAYSVPRIETWSKEERDQILGIKPEFDPLADRQLKLLLAKQHDLERRIAALIEAQEQEGEALFLDRVMVMELPNGGGEMKYRSESTAFSRRMTLEGELNKVQGRVQKLLDSIRAREDATERMKFERERFEFSRQKALGQFSIDVEEEDAKVDEEETIIE